jgi:hypothetical protein
MIHDGNMKLTSIILPMPVSLSVCMSTGNQILQNKKKSMQYNATLRR